MKKYIRPAAATLCALLVSVSLFGCGGNNPSSGNDSTDKTTSETGATTSLNSDTTATSDMVTTEAGQTTVTDKNGNNGNTSPNATTKKVTSVTTAKDGGWNTNTPTTGKKLFDKRKGVKGEVRVFIPWDTSSDKNFKNIIEGFKKEYPGTSVKLITGEWATRDIKITQMIRAGDSPDYLPASVADFPRRAIKNMMMPINDLIQVTDNLDTYVMDNISAKDGKKYAVMGKRAPSVLYYNTTMLKNAAIVNTPTKLFEQDKWTWTELKNMARKLTVDTNKDGKPDIYGFGTELEYIFPLAQGTDIIKMNKGKATLNIDDQVWRSSLLFYYDGINKDKIFSPVRWGMWEEFANNKVAMYFGPSGESEKILNKGMKNWDIAPFPKAKSTDKEYIGSSTTDGFGVATGAKNAVGGLAFGEYQMNYYTKLGQSSSAKKIFTDAQTKMMKKIESRITWLYGYGMEDSFCQSFGNYMRKNGDFTALMEEMRPIWQKNLDDTLKGR